MWKMLLILLAVAAAMLMARLVYDPPVIQTRVGMIEAPIGLPMQDTYAYAGVRG